MPKLKYGMMGLNKATSKSIKAKGDGEMLVTQASSYAFPDRTMKGGMNDEAFNQSKQYGTPMGMYNYDKKFMKKMNANPKMV